MQQLSGVLSLVLAGKTLASAKKLHPAWYAAGFAAAVVAGVLIWKGDELFSGKKKEG
jgi:hypothetical protein